MYPIGTLKVAWVESNVEYLSSDMFKPNELDKAVAYGENVGDYMIMQLVSQEKDLYRWRVLPYGNHKQYLSSMRLRRKFEKLFSNESGYYEAPTGGIFTDKEEYEKQLVRIADVFVLGPFLIYVSTIKSLPKHIRVILLLIGILTIIYNGNNYIKTIK
jgi:hypothetical protein